MSRFFRGLKISYNVFMSYVFGKYKISGYDGTGEYNIFEWNGLPVHQPKHQCYTVEQYEKERQP